MKLDLTQIMAEERSSLPFDYTLDLSGMEINGAFPFDEPVRFSGAVINSAGVLRIAGSLETTAHPECSRCLVRFPLEKTVSVDGVLVGEGADPEGDDVFPVDPASAELDDIAIAFLIPAMDMVTLCRPDCKGLCPRCGTDLNNGQCSCRDDYVDPRLAVLAKLFEEKDEK